MADKFNLSCPCCGFPTLKERAGYEICAVCWWEDDGQDNAHAGEVWGGPNYEYSLAAARCNFLDHCHMYDLGRGIDAVERPNQSRIDLIAYLREVRSGDRKFDQAKLYSLILAVDRAL